MAMLWEAVGFGAILIFAVASRLLLASGREPFLMKLSAAFHELPQFIGPAIFFDAFFAMAAVAIYAPAIDIKFARTLSLSLVSFTAWIFILALIMFPFEWPLLVLPSNGQHYQPSLAIQIWVGGWLLLGPELSTVWVSWRRNQTPGRGGLNDCGDSRSI
jgi:hypothetical protein